MTSRKNMLTLRHRNQSRKLRSRKLRLEPLEDRRLLAADLSSLPYEPFPNSDDGLSSDPVLIADGCCAALFGDLGSLAFEADNITGDVFLVSLSSATTGVSVVGDDLLIADSSGGDTDNQFKLSTDGTSLFVHDANNLLTTAILGADGNGTNTVTIPLTAFSGGIVVNALAGNDTLTVDFSGGNPIPQGGLSFHGGNPTSGPPGDALVLDTGTWSGSFHTITHTFLNESDGGISLDLDGSDGDPASTISYTGLEPVGDNLDAAHRVFTFNVGAETITLQDIVDAGGNQMQIDSSVGGETVQFANPSGSLTINAGSGNDVVVVASVDSAYGASLIINGDGGNDAVNLNADITFASGNFLDVDLANDASAGDVDSITVGASANLKLSGSGGATLKASQNVALSGGSSVEVVDGNLTVEANQQAVPTGGSFVGVDVNNGLLHSSGTGIVTVKGRGGDFAGSGQHGVHVRGGGDIVGGTATNAIVGTGGRSTGASNYGVFVTGSGSTVTSSGGGSVTVTGQGGGDSAVVDGNYGVWVVDSGTITSGGNGPVTVTGTGGAGAGKYNYGVWVHNSGTITSGGGDVTVNGQGGGGAGSGIQNYGVLVRTGASITSGGAGTVTVTGTGGSGGGIANFGVYVYDSGTVTSGGAGQVAVTGIGGSGNGGDNHGVYVDYSGMVRSGGVGPVAVTGSGGSGTGNRNVGVWVYRTATITSGGTGPVVVTGTGGSGSGSSNYGVWVTDGNAQVTSGGGNITVSGTGGGSGAASSGHVGVNVTNTGAVSGVGAATVTVTGMGGANGSVAVVAGGSINSVSGDILIDGVKDGAGLGADVVVNGPVTTTAGGDIEIRSDRHITGNAGGDLTSAGTTDGNITITADEDGVGSPNGAGTIRLSGDLAAGTGVVTFSLRDCDGWIGATAMTGDGEILSAGGVIKAGLGALRLNGAANGYTGTTDVNAGTLLVNGSLTADVGVVHVNTGGTLGGNGTIGSAPGAREVLVHPGGVLDPGEITTAGCAPLAGRLTVNGDVEVQPASGLQPAGTFRVQLGGLTPGAGGYDQLVLNGGGNLSGAVADGAGGGVLDVQLVSGYSVPVGGEYVIISNDQTDLIGTRFLGLPEGAFLSPVPNLLMNISYLSGADDNDVVLTTPGRYDFNGFGGHTEENYLPLSPFQTKSGNTAGWVGTLPWYFERGAADDSDWDRLRYDGQSTDPMGTPLQFQVDVADNKTYEVMILTGDLSWNHDKQSFTVTADPAGDSDSEVVNVWGAGAPDGSGTQVTWGGGAANPDAGYYRWVRLTVTVADGATDDTGSITLDMRDLGGSNGTTVILAMDIRPVEAVGQLTLVRDAVSADTPPFDVLPADGLTVDKYTGTGAPPNAVLTVTVSAGGQYALVTPDTVPAADAAIPSAVNAYQPTFGGQVKSGADGTFEFSVQRPATLTTNAASEGWTIVVEESSGLSRGTAVQPYEAPSQSAPLRFDFGATTSPVQTNFLQVVPQTIYSTARGYGWATRVSAGDRRDNYTTVSYLANPDPNLPNPPPGTHDTASALRTDFNSGRNATFKADVPNGSEAYSVRLYHSNPLYFGSVPYTTQPFTVTVENVTYVVPQISPGTTFIQEVSGVTVDDGTLDILFGVNNSAFMIAGIDISRGSPPDASLLLAAGSPQDSPAAAIGLDDLQSMVAEAVAQWTATGLTAAQAATLASVQFAVADLGGTSLGLARPATNTIHIDDDAAMVGWSVVRGRSSIADHGSPTTGMDLLAVVMHELGHLLGYEHSDDADDLMAPVLAAGRTFQAREPFGQAGLGSATSSLLAPSSFLSSRFSIAADAAFADWGRDGWVDEDGAEDGLAGRLSSQGVELLAAATVPAGEEAGQAKVARRSRLQRSERDLEGWFAELAAEHLGLSR